MDKLTMHNDYLNLMYNRYSTNSEWPTTEEVNESIKLYKNISNYNHYDLLELITNGIYNNLYNIKHLKFLKSLLFTLLEENAISQIYSVPRGSEFNNLLFNLDRQYRYGMAKNEAGERRLFYEPGKGITVSNTQLYFLIDIILKKISRSKSRRRTRPRSKSRSRSRSRSKSRSRSRSRERLEPHSYNKRVSFNSRSRSRENR